MGMEMAPIALRSVESSGAGGFRVYWEFDEGLGLRF